MAHRLRRGGGCARLQGPGQARGLHLVHPHDHARPPLQLARCLGPRGQAMALATRRGGGAAGRARRRGRRPRGRSEHGAPPRAPACGVRGGGRGGRARGRRRGGAALRLRGGVRGVPLPGAPYDGAAPPLPRPRRAGAVQLRARLPHKGAAAAVLGACVADPRPAAAVVLPAACARSPPLRRAPDAVRCGALLLHAQDVLPVPRAQPLVAPPRRLRSGEARRLPLHLAQGWRCPAVGCHGEPHGRHPRLAPARTHRVRPGPAALLHRQRRLLARGRCAAPAARR
mmetsp:Transcript_3944/g.9874  ORF Transcript_3944/g.9874 Transcript_3944/m.9874 type:complete len:284 (+) Transcript_3944:82-933(+)